MNTAAGNGRRAAGGAPIGVAVLGCGGIARSHFAGWQRPVAAGQARLEVLCDLDPARAFEECWFERPDQTHPDGVGEALVLRVPYAAGFHAQEIEFLAAIREGREPESSGIDGARALEVVEGAYRAARERRTIDFPLVDWAALVRTGRQEAAAGAFTSWGRPLTGIVNRSIR